MACKYIYESKEYTKEEFYKFVGDNLVEKKSVPKYNKILFPTGNTASKVEGHSTLEEFKKQKEDRIKELENSITIEDKLKIFFNQFGFKYKEGDSSIDLLNKIIYVSNKDSSLFIDNSVKALSQLLLANTNIDFSKLESLIEDTPEFKKLLSNSSNYLKTTHKFLKNGNRIPMEEWVLYIKEYNKIKSEVLEKYLKESLLDGNNSTKLHKLINDFLKWFKDLFTNAKNLKEVTDSLIQQVLFNQKEVIVNSKDLQNKEKVTLAKALEETTHGKDIIKTFGEFGLILTGSVSAAEQGSVFRKVGKLLHDIDWVIPKGFTKDFNKKLKDTFPGATLVREFDSTTYYTQTYIVPPKGYTIANLTFFKPEIYGKNKYIASYDVLDKNGNIVSNYKRYYDVKSSGKVVENKELYNEGLQNVDKNLEAVAVDFFQNKEDLKYEPYNVSIEGINLQLSNWLSSFTEKLKYGRAKDLLDYANFIPNDLQIINDETKNEINQLKQELERVETEGFGALKPIYNFYENTVTNILNKQFGKENVKKVTDEYGNTWNEILLNNSKNYTVDLLPLSDEQSKNVVDSLKSSILVPGLTVNQQNDIVTDLAKLLHDELTNSKTKKINDRFSFEKYKKFLEDLLIVYKDTPRGNVIQNVLNNWATVKNITRMYFGKMQGVKMSEIKLQVDNQFQETTTTVNAEDDVITEEESNLGEKDYSDNASLTENYKNTISSNIRRLLSFIPSGETNFVGSPKYVSFDESYNTVKQILNGSKPDLDEMISKLKENAIAKPWLNDAIKTIKNTSKQTQNEFVMAMAMHNVEMSFLMWEKKNNVYKLTPYSSNSNSVSQVVLSNWFEAAKLNGLIELKNGDLFYNKDITDKFKTQIQNLKTKLNAKDFTVTSSDIDNIFKSIGIDLQQGTLEELSKNKRSVKNLVDSNGVLTAIEAKLNSTEDVITNNYLSDSSVRKLARLDAKYTKNVFDSSFKAGVNSVSSSTLNKFLTNQIRDLKEDRVLITSMLKTSFSSNSYLLKNLVHNEITEDVKNEAEVLTGSREITLVNGIVYASDGQAIFNKKGYFYNNFNYEYLSLEAVKKMRSSSKDGRELKNLSAAEHEFIKIGFFQKAVKTQTKDGIRVAQMFYPTCSDKTTMFLVTNILHNTEFGLDKETLSTKTINALYDALVIPEINRMKNYKPTGISGYDKGYNLFYFLPQLNKINELFSNGKLVADYTTNPELINKVKTELTEVVNQLIENKINEWNKYGFSEKKYLDSEYMKSIKDKAKNPLKYAAADFVINNLIHNANMFQVSISDPALYYKSKSNDPIERVEDTFINIGKRLAGDIAPGYEINNAYKENYRFAVIADKKSQSTAIDYLNKVLKDKAKAYREIEAGDAQEYTTLAEHLDLMYAMGKISDEKYHELLSKAINKSELSEEDLQLILQPVKPVYVGNKMEAGKDVVRRMYIKSSSFPLIPQLTKGLQIDALREAMEANNIDRVAFNSAVKVGAPINPLDIFDDNGNMISDIDFSKTEVLQLNRSGFRIQQELPFDKDKVNVGTQERKLLFVNLLDTPGFQYNSKSHTGKELQDIYHNYYHRLFQRQHDSLLEELGYNKDTDSINIESLQKILKKEAEDRDYPINDIIGLQLGVDGKFKIPLYMLPSSKRYESLLNAIVDNRVRKMKFTGSSFILGSEEGFRTKVVEGEEANSELEKYSNDIVYTTAWTGKLLAKTDKNLVQAIVPFKFRNTDGELLDLTKYIKETVDGKKMLDTEKLPKELLNIFGFRIPTQGLNSMSQIEVVGFLPKSAGDLIIASKDFTKQMGSDFDIDKLYSYIYAHYTDRNGVIHKITESNITHLIDDIEFTTSKFQPKKGEDYDGYVSSKSLDSTSLFLQRIADLYDIDYNTDGDSRDKFLKKLKDKFTNLAIQNSIIDIHFAVLANEHPDVASQIATPLDFGDLKEGEDLAAKVNEWRKQRNIQEVFNGLSDSYQKQKFLNATAGKSGIGVFSLDSVFNSIAQGKNLQYIINIENEETGQYENIFSVKYGKLESVGDLSDPKTLNKKKNKSDVIAAFQSASVDNEKEQILDKLNINSYTYDAIRILAQLGFDESTIVATIAQDIIFDYVKESTIRRSSLYDYTPGLDTIIKEAVYDKYKALLKGEVEDLLSLINKKKEASTEELLDYIKNGDKNNHNDYVITQLATFEKFLELTDYGKELKRIQSAINTDSGGLGKSLFATITKEEAVRNLPNSPVKNAERLIGNFLPEGKIEPTTINGFATVYGLFTNNKLWSKYFPYQEENIQNIVGEITNSDVTTVKTIDISKKEEAYREVFENIKSYILTRSDLGLFNTTPFLRREYLLKEFSSSIQHKLATKDKLFINNPFLNKLSVEQDKQRGVNYIKYNASSIESYFENNIYAGFLQLIDKPVKINENYTTRDLADDFVQYSYLLGGKQQAVDFIRYIPIEYLNQLPFASKLKELDFKNVDVLDNIIRTDKTPYYHVSEFTTQYIQHNPEKVFALNDNTKVEFSKPKDISVFTLSKEELKKVDKTKDKFPVFVTYKENLYQFNGEKYVRISILGAKYDITEYDANSTNVKSVINKQNSATDYELTYIPSSDEDIDNSSRPSYEDVISVRNRKYGLYDNNVKNTLANLISLSTNVSYQRLAQEYLDVINKLDFKINLQSDVNLPSRGLTSYQKNGDVTITINSSNAISSSEELEKTILHEVTHALTKYLIHADEKSLTETQRKTRDKLSKFKDLFVEKVGKDKVKSVIDKINEFKKTQDNKFRLTTEELDLTYAGKNLEEFIALAMTSEKFQQFMAKEIWQGDKSMLDKFFELVKDLIKSLGINVGEDLNKYIYHDILNLIKSQVKDSTTIDEEVENTETKEDLLPLNKEFSSNTANFKKEDVSLTIFDKPESIENFKKRCK